jgi:hypothetical protein
MSIPRGSFSNEALNTAGSGNAGKGMNMGLKLSYRLTDNFGLAGAMNILLNPFSSEVRKDVKEKFPMYSAFNFPEYINASLGGGVRFIHHINGDFYLYADLGTMVDFLKVTRYGFGPQNSDTHLVEYKLSIEPGFRLAAALMWREKLEFGAEFFHSFEHSIDGDYIRGALPGEPDLDQKISIITLNAGYWMF